MSAGSLVRTMPLLLAAVAAVGGVVGCRSEEPGSVEAPSLEPEPPRNLLLIVVDTLRATHLSCHGYERLTSPNVDELASRGIRFDQCFSPARWTLPALSSILTSVHPVAHGAVAPGKKLPARLETLAERLGRRGFQTQAFVSGYFAEAKHGLGQGFQGFDATNSIGRNGVTSVSLTDDVTSWLREHGRTDPDRRFFLLAHYYEPHYNYMHHPEHSFCGDASEHIYSNIRIEEIRARAARLTSDDFDTLIGYYDGEIHLMDQEVGRLLRALSDLGLDEETLVVFTADHGEEFAEHAPHFGHNGTMCDHVLHVPWVMAVPGRDDLAGRVVERVVGTLDIVPTVLPLLGLDVDSPVQGSDVLGEGTAVETPRVSTSRYGDRAINIDGWSLQIDARRGLRRLYDRRRDPVGTRDRWKQQRAVAERLLEELDCELRRLEAFGRASESMDLTRSEAELIRSLGYADEGMKKRFWPGETESPESR